MIKIDDLLDTLDAAKIQALLFVEQSKHIQIEREPEKAANRGMFINNNPLDIDDYEVLFFYFEDVLPNYKNKDREYGKAISSFFNLSVSRQLTTARKKIDAENFVIYIEQRFKENYVRDLDNRNRKLLIDALKYNLIFKDDSFQYISIFEEGFGGNYNNEMLVYVVDKLNFPRFLQDKKTTKFNVIDSEIFERKKALKEYMNEL